jgi:hypothetical protein
MKREIKLVQQQDENRLITILGNQLWDAGYNSDTACIITVSTDYSSVVGQYLRHRLSIGGEVCEGFGVDVPYPDESWDAEYQSALSQAFTNNIAMLTKRVPILVEAGVIRGSNYIWITEWMNNHLAFDKKIITLALYENIQSRFKSDFVGEYYNDDVEDLTFWWEQENRHWE